MKRSVEHWHWSSGRSLSGYTRECRCRAGRVKECKEGRPGRKVYAVMVGIRLVAQKNAQRSASSSSLVSTHAALDARAARHGLDTRESLLDPTALTDQTSSSRPHSIASDSSLGSRLSTTQYFPPGHQPLHHHHGNQHQNQHASGYHHESTTGPSSADSPAQMYASSTEADLEDGRDSSAGRPTIRSPTSRALR
jgi:hypothetical protein